MSKRHIFVSCGQRTEEEKRLGESICQVIREHGVFDCFFAESQHSLNGLHENILDALAKSDGFITVIHRRGNVSYGQDKHEPLDRASVWIEQEIAIAAYIQRTTKSDLLTVAYIEKGVGREGLRELLHLNPIEFTLNEEIVVDLKLRLKTWHKSSSDDSLGKLELESTPGYQSGIHIRNLAPILTNQGKRANEYSCTLEIPEALLSFTSAFNVTEVPRIRPGYRRFQTTEATKNNAPLIRDNPVKMLIQEVAIAHLNEEQKQQVLKQDLQVSAEIEDRVYSLTKSCAEVFAETQLAQGEEVTKQSAQRYQQPINQGPDGWMA